MGKYNSIVTLSRTLNLEDGSLPEELKRRVDKSIYLYNLGDSDSITMSGKNGGKDKDFGTHAQAMHDYAISRKTQGRILKEEKSLDTVGQAYFVKTELAVPRNWSNLIVVSSDYHLPRVRKIFDLIFGPDFSITYTDIPTSLSRDPAILSNEARSLETFLSQFKGLKPGDHKSAAGILLRNHPLYKGQVDLFFY